MLTVISIACLPDNHYVLISRASNARLRRFLRKRARLLVEILSPKPPLKALRLRRRLRGFQPLKLNKAFCS